MDHDVEKQILDLLRSMEEILARIERLFDQSDSRKSES